MRAEEVMPGLGEAEAESGPECQPRESSLGLGEVPGTAPIPASSWSLELPAPSLQAELRGGEGAGRGGGIGASGQRRGGGGWAGLAD